MNLSIAIPDSCLGDGTTNLDKSRKVSAIARACAIFRVETIYVYEHGASREDKSLLLTVLRYLDTPQFLRRRLFPKMNELKYAGVLQPLKIASHVTPADSKTIRNGTIRDGIVVRTGGRLFADFGINTLLPYRGRTGPGKRVTARFRSGEPEFRYVEILKGEAPRYWGYTVKERGPLARFLDSWKGATVLTSRKGKPATIQQIRGCQGISAPLLVVYGSTDAGVHDILGRNPNSIPNSRVLDFFPGQATETVRLEEAIMGTLAMLNLP